MSTVIDLGAFTDLHLEPLHPDQYRAMIEAGILDRESGVELVDGLLVSNPGSGPLEPCPLTVEQYHAMIAAGILLEGEPVELLDGLRVRKDRRDESGDVMTVGPRHSRTIDLLLRALMSRLADRDCFVQCQQPATLQVGQEPEPDVAIVLGNPKDFLKRHPGPEDQAVVIEVAGSSLATDRQRKQRIYAEAGIPVYWIVNLNEDVVEVYESPDPESGRYAKRTVVTPGQSIELHLGDRKIPIPVDEFLPVDAN